MTPINLHENCFAEFPILRAFATNRLLIIPTVRIHSDCVCDLNPKFTDWYGHQLAAKIPEFPIINIAWTKLKPPGGHTSPWILGRGHIYR